MVGYGIKSHHIQYLSSFTASCTSTETSLNPFTLRAPPESIVCYFHTFENNLGIKRKFKKYLKESCCLTSGQHFSIKYFPKNAFYSKCFNKNCQACFGHSECEWVNPSNAEATFVPSTRMQRFLKII